MYSPKFFEILKGSIALSFWKDGSAFIEYAKDISKEEIADISKILGNHGYVCTCSKMKEELRKKELVNEPR